MVPCSRLCPGSYTNSREEIVKRNARTTSKMVKSRYQVRYPVLKYWYRYLFREVVSTGTRVHSIVIRCHFFYRNKLQNPDPLLLLLLLLLLPSSLLHPSSLPSPPSLCLHSNSLPSHTPSPTSPSFLLLSLTYSKFTALVAPPSRVIVGRLCERPQRDLGIVDGVLQPTLINRLS
jgi:hypothetical protein